MLSASYSGDNSYNASSSTYAITVTPAPMTFSLQPAGATFVSGIPFQVFISGQAQALSGVAPTGTVTIFDGNTQLGNSITVNGTPGSPPNFTLFPSVTIPTGGTHTLTANYSGDSNYALASSPAANVFVLWQTTPTVSVSSTNINYGQSVTVTASVATAGKTPPMTGTFSFFGSFTSIPGPVTPMLTTDASGNQTLSATITTTPQDSENIQLTYSGDTNYASSSVVSNFINVNIPDFSLPNTTITVTAGQSQSATVNVTPLSSMPSTVTLSAATFVSLPPGMSLSFNPSTVSLNGAPVPVVITLTTTGPSGGPSAAAPVVPVARPTLEQRRWIWWSGSLVSGLVLLALLAMSQWRKRAKLILAASAAFIVTLALGCGGGSPGGGGGGGGGPVPTSITLTTSQAKVASGASFTLTATVTSTKPLTGTVNIFQGHPPNGEGVAPPIQVVNGTARTTVMNPFGPGTYEYWAQYTGDPNNLPSQTTTSVQEVLTGTTTAVYTGQTGGLTHQAQITITLQ